MVISYQMSFLGKVKFWKKEDEFDFDKLAEQEIQKGPDETGLGPIPGFEEKTAAEEPPVEGLFTSKSASPSPYKPGAGLSTGSARDRDRDLELLNSKLDTIKALLISMDQRLANLEKYSGVEQKQRLW